MFKVHNIFFHNNHLLREFQNISCLRFIPISNAEKCPNVGFQNISCLRFIRFDYINAAQIVLFQNISCLRFIAIISSFMN